MFEQFPKSHEHDPAHDAGTRENRGEQFENTRREGAVNASFILIGTALGLVGTEGCDISKILEPEAQTESITFSQSVEKKFGQ